VFFSRTGMFTLNETVVTDALCKSDSILDVVGVLISFISDAVPIRPRVSSYYRIAICVIALN
jgi:hypothetical protein